jgi:hypothetical protein
MLLKTSSIKYVLNDNSVSISIEAHALIVLLPTLVIFWETLTSLYVVRSTVAVRPVKVHSVDNGYFKVLIQDFFVIIYEKASHTISAVNQ